MRQTQQVKTGIPTATKGLNMEIRNKARDGQSLAPAIADCKT